MKFTRKEIWQHNSFLGRTKMAMTAMNAIVQSPTATMKAKNEAGIIFIQLSKLYNLLKEKAVAN